MRRSWIRQIPNALSWSRVGVAFIFPIAPASWRISLISWALISEFLDGFLARRLKAESKFGQALDPIADKLFVLSTILVLVMESRMTVLAFSLVAMRDIVVALGSLSVTLESKRHAWLYLKPRLSGKITTALQFLLLIGLYIHFRFSMELLILTSTVSCLSAIDYLYAVLHRRFDAGVTAEPS